MLLGEMLVAEGVIKQDQLDKALEKQKSAPAQKIGEVLLEMGFIDVETFTKVLEKQLKESGLMK